MITLNLTIAGTTKVNNPGINISKPWPEFYDLKHKEFAYKMVPPTPQAWDKYRLK